MRVLGLLGALDPYKYKILVRGVGTSAGSSKEVSEDKQASENASDLLITVASGQLDDFFPIMAVSSLMKVLKDGSLQEHHILCIRVSSSFQHLQLSQVFVIINGRRM